MLVSLNKLSELTGVSRATVRRRLGPLIDGDEQRTVAHTFDSAQALRLIYGHGAEQLDAVQEKAMLDRTRRELLELEIQIKRGEVIPAETVTQTWQSIGANIKAKLMNLPTRLVTATHGAATLQDAEKEAKALIRECLMELSANGTPK